MYVGTYEPCTDSRYTVSSLCHGVRPGGDRLNRKKEKEKNKRKIYEPVSLSGRCPAWIPLLLPDKMRSQGPKFPDVRTQI
jgi:hypothetical protein